MNKITVKEFIWYAASGLVAAFGVIAMVFGIIEHQYNGLSENNFVTAFRNKIHLTMDLRFVGIILLAVGVVVGIVALLVNAKKADREVEKKLRREQRLAAQSNLNIEVKKAVEVIEEQPTVEAEAK